eukprot:TRINITY_DN23921_c0_g4_i1.p1 TRINITY_DN23921_c0_g4~~TRINITY_DN23921_c0_g4_i1.p1  ORF type:complete len:748 (+),score=76.93 TRINITY_DN23921_c0_g4_i1:107-2350(+)
MARSELQTPRGALPCRTARSTSFLLACACAGIAIASGLDQSEARSAMAVAHKLEDGNPNVAAAAKEDRDCELGSWSSWSDCPTLAPSAAPTPSGDEGFGNATDGEANASDPTSEFAGSRDDSGTRRLQGGAHAWLGAADAATLTKLGIAYRSREVTRPEQGGARLCRKPLSDIQLCSAAASQLAAPRNAALGAPDAILTALGEPNGSLPSCVLGDWSDWSGCPAQRPSAAGARSCGYAAETRLRTPAAVPCALPSPIAGGFSGCGEGADSGGKDANCTARFKSEGAVLESRLCPVSVCNIDCQLDDWSEYGRCGPLCSGGNGTQTRSRKVLTSQGGNGTHCSDQLVDERTCTAPCDCKVSAFADWGSCVHVDKPVVDGVDGENATPTQEPTAKAAVATANSALERRAPSPVPTSAPTAAPSYVPTVAPSSYSPTPVPSVPLTTSTASPTGQNKSNGRRLLAGSGGHSGVVDTCVRVRRRQVLAPAVGSGASCPNLHETKSCPCEEVDSGIVDGFLKQIGSNTSLDNFLFSLQRKWLNCTDRSPGIASPTGWYCSHVARVVFVLGAVLLLIAFAVCIVCCICRCCGSGDEILMEESSGDDEYDSVCASLFCCCCRRSPGRSLPSSRDDIHSRVLSERREASEEACVDAPLLLAGSSGSVRYDGPGAWRNEYPSGHSSYGTANGRYGGASLDDRRQRDAALMELPRVGGYGGYGYDAVPPTFAGLGTRDGACGFGGDVQYSAVPTLGYL